MLTRTVLPMLFYLFVLLVPQTAFALGPPNFVPDGAHPRIWLNAEMMARLTAKQKSADPDWVALESWCDLHISDALPTTKDYSWGDSGNGYRGSGYLVRLRNYALGYQVLKSVNPVKANQYASYAIALLDRMVQIFSAGEEFDGISMIRMGASTDITINSGESAVNGTLLQGSKNGYTARNFGFALPLAYDWLYEKLTPDQKLKYVKVMYRWMDWCRGLRSTYNNGILIGGLRYHEDASGDCTGSNICTSLTGVATRAYQNEQAGVNFQTDFAAMDAFIAIATYGDTADSGTYLAKFKNERWTTQIIPYLGSPLYFKGGDSLEGMSYFSSWQDLISAMWAYSEATGDDLFASVVWPKELLTSYITQTASNLTDVVGEGDWPGNSIRKAYEKFVIGPAYIVRRKYPTDPLGAVSQDYLTNANFSLADYPANRLLWRENVTPTSLSTLPLSNVAIGTGLTAMRSTWANNPDTNFASIQLGQGWRMSHQSYNQGSMLIQRGPDWVLARNVAVTTTEGQNTIVFNGKQQYASNPVPQNPPITNFQDTGRFLYIRGNLLNAHQRQYNPNLCNQFFRELVYVRPNYYVVKDTTESNTTLGNLKEWCTNYISQPTLTTDTISATVGQSEIFVKTLFPAGTFTTSNPSTGYYRVKFTPQISQEYDQFLHLIQTTTSTSGSLTQAELVKSVDGSVSKMMGVYIKDTSSPTVVMFSTDKSGNGVTGSVSYTLSASPLGIQPAHILVNMPGNTFFTLVRPTDLTIPQTFQVLQIMDQKQGVVAKSSDQGVLFFPAAPGSPRVTGP